MEDKIITYGGQAVIEGVMMRGQKAFAIAMRAPDGNIVVHRENLAAVYRSRITKIPFLRGVILLWDALGLGMRALTLSANTQTGEDEKLEGPALYLTLGVSLALGIGLFFLLPAGIGGLAEKYLGWNSWLANLLEGVVRLVLLVGYIWAIGFMPDVKRLFGYHGPGIGIHSRLYCAGTSFALLETRQPLVIDPCPGWYFGGIHPLDRQSF